MSGSDSGAAPLSLGVLLATALSIAAWPLLPTPWRLTLAISGPSLGLLFGMALWKLMNVLDAHELKQRRAQIPGSDAGVDG